jgi:hypothetical protein
LDRLYETEAASQWLNERGIRRSPKTLRKLRCVGGGPRFRYLNRKPYYTEPDLVDWVENGLTERFSSTSEAGVAAERRPPAAGLILPPRRGRRGCGDEAARSAMDSVGPATARAGPMSAPCPYTGLDLTAEIENAAPRATERRISKTISTTATAGDIALPRLSLQTRREIKTRGPQ